MGSKATAAPPAQDFSGYVHPEPVPPPPRSARADAEPSRLGERHCLICGNVAWVLNNHVRVRGRGYVLTNTPSCGPESTRGPEVALRERHALLCPGRRKSGVGGGAQHKGVRFGRLAQWRSDRDGIVAAAAAERVASLRYG